MLMTPCCWFALGLILLTYLCRLLMSRTHPNPQVAEEVMRLHAFLLVCPATRCGATQRTIQQMLHTVRHLSLEAPGISKPADTTGTTAPGTVRSTDGNDIVSGSGGDTGLHDQLSSISTYIAAVDEAVSSHRDAAVCLAIWRQAVHLAPPTGKTGKPSGLGIQDTVGACGCPSCDQELAIITHCAWPAPCL